MKRELLELKQKLMQRFLDNAIDQATYDRMLAEIEAMAEEESSVSPPSQTLEPNGIVPGSIVVEMPGNNVSDVSGAVQSGTVLPSFVTVLPPGAQYYAHGQLPGMYPPGTVFPGGMIQSPASPYHTFPGTMPTVGNASPGAGFEAENAQKSMMSVNNLEVRTASGVKHATQWHEEIVAEQNAPNPEIDPLVVKALKRGETLEIWWHFNLTPECVVAWKKINVPLRLSLAMNEFIDDEAMQLLGQITNLREINLTSTRITDEGLRYLSPLVNLESLILTSTDITGETLGNLDKCLNLRELTLTSTLFRNEGMGYLTQFQNLDTLKLDDTNITDEGMVALAGLHQLQLLNLQGTLVSDAGLQHVAHLTTLIELYLGGTIPFDGEDYESPITDNGVEYLKNLTELRVLHLNDTQVTNACLASLKKITELYELNVTDTYFSDDALKHLRKFRNLGDVIVDGTLITESAVKKIFGSEGTKIFRGARTGSWNKLGHFLLSPWSRKN